MTENTPEQEKPGTAVAELQGARPLERARQNYSDEEIAAIAKFLNVKAEDTALIPFLAIAAQLDLSPIHGEIWLIKGRRKEDGEWVDFYRPAVGRDGLLKHARKQETFKGIRFGVVCEYDTFEVEDDGWETKILHRPASLQAGQEPGHESRWRGKVLGAWAKLFFKDDRPPLYYFAPAHEHVKTEQKSIDGETVTDFAGAWSYTSAMIIKSAVSYVCRIGYGVTGVVPFDEIRVDDPQMTGENPNEWAGNEGELDEDPSLAIADFVNLLDIPDPLANQLIGAFDSINDLAPYSWTPAKLRMRLGSDCDVEKAQSVLGEAEREFEALRKQQVAKENRIAKEALAQEAIQVVLARDVKPPIELHMNEGESEPVWVMVEDVIFDDAAGTMAFKLSGNREQTYSPTAEVEVRTPTDPEGTDPAEQ